MPMSSSLEHSSFEKNYRIQKFLGKGSFAKVYKCVENSSGQVVAVKEIQNPGNREGTNEVQNEIEICRELNHDNIASLHSAFTDGEGRHFLVLEFVDGESLFDEIVRQTFYSEGQACRIIKQLLCALDYLHKKRIVHRDVKPDNLLVTKRGAHVTIKLVDFGLARRLPPGCDVIRCDVGGAPLFLAPETILEEPIGQPVDMWACGVILFILLVGYPPFWSDNEEQLLLSILQGLFSLPSPYWEKISPNAKDLVRKLLVSQPGERVTCAEALEHPWITAETNLESTGSELTAKNDKRLTFMTAACGVRALLKFQGVKVEKGCGRRLSESGALS